MITRETDYAIRTVLILARMSKEDKTTSARKLSDKENIPYSFLRKIIHKLADKKIICSQKGKGGGICLNRENENLSLKDIIYAIDSDCIKLNLCLTNSGNCPNSPKCQVHDKLGEIQSYLDKKFENILIKDLI